MKATAAEGSTADLLQQTVARLLARYFLANRIAVRLVEGFTWSALSGGHVRAFAVAGACVVYDIGTAWLLRRSRLPVWARIGLDSLDVAAWSLVIGHANDVAGMLAVPLCLELGLRSGWRGPRPSGQWAGSLVTPLAGSAVIGVVASTFFVVSGQRPVPGPLLWPLASSIFGILIAAYLGGNLERKLALAARQTEAAAGQAELAGQNSIAMGADTVVDLLARTASLAGQAGAQAAASPLAAWRAALADASAGRATYLGVAVARWQRLRNSMSPDLTADVDLCCAGASGAVLLSPDQARHLERSLDRLRLQGTVRIEVRSPAAAGRPQVILVGRRRLILPADPVPEGPVVDLGPVAFGLGGLVTMGQSLPGSDAVPLWVTLPITGAAAGLAWWSHRHLERYGSPARATVLAVALALGAVDALVASVTPGNSEVGGLPRLPSLLFLMWVGPLMVVYWKDLQPEQRALAIGVALAIALAGISLRLGPHVPVQLLTAPLWPGMAVLTSLGLRDILEMDTAEIRRHVQRRHLAAVESAYRQGRQFVVELAANAARETREACDRVRGELGPALAVEVDRRLIEVDRRLSDLRLAI